MSQTSHQDQEAAQAASRLPFPVGLLCRAGGAVSALLIAATLIIMVANVVARYVMADPFRGAEELTGYLVVAMVMAGAAETYRRGDHIAIELFQSGRFPVLARLSGILFDLAVLTFAGILGWTGWNTVMFSRDFESYSAGYLETPMWIPQSVLVIGAALLALAAATRLGLRLLGKG